MLMLFFSRCSHERRTKNIRPIWRISCRCIGRCIPLNLQILYEEINCMWHKIIDILWVFQWISFFTYSVRFYSFACHQFAEPALAQWELYTVYVFVFKWLWRRPSNVIDVTRKKNENICVNWLETKVNGGLRRIIKNAIHKQKNQCIWMSNA